jgi:hypothetical protein
LIKLKKLRLVLSLVMLSLIVSVVSVSERCYAGPVEEALRVAEIWRAESVRIEKEERKAAEARRLVAYARTLELELQSSICCPGGTREEKLNWVIRVIPTRPKEQFNASSDYLEYVKEQLKKECA